MQQWIYQHLAAGLQNKRRECE